MRLEAACRRHRALSGRALAAAVVILMPVLLGATGALAQEAETTTTTAGEGEAPAEEPTTAVGGTLRHEGEGVEGVTLVVTDSDDNEVGETETGDDGTWRVALPGTGRYTITLDTDTLPDDVELRNEDADSRTLSVPAGRERTVLFPLGEGAGGGGTGFWERFGQATANGVKFGLIIAMAAIGLSLIFGTSGLINFAHGELVTFGAVVAWYLNIQGPRLHLITAAAVTVMIGGLLGAVLERGLWRPLRERKVGSFQLLVVSIGLALLGRYMILLFFGAQRRPYRNFTLQQRLDLWLFDMTPRDLAIIVISIVLLVGVAILLRTTRLGKAMRAVADNFDLAESSGIDVRRIIMVVWVLGTALAALGGIFFGLAETVEWQMGFRLLLLMFAGVILGGLGTAYGALAGSLVVGIGTEISTLWFSPEIKFLWALALLIAVLLFRPQGIFGVRERVG